MNGHMKKLLIPLLAALFLLPSCIGVEKPDVPAEEPDNTPVAAVMEYTMKATDETLGTLDLTVKYYDADGTVHSDAITKTTWTKTVKCALPAKFGACIEVALKSGAVVTGEETFHVNCGYSYKTYAVNAAGETVGRTYAYGDTHKTDMARHKIPTWLEKRSGPLVKFGYNFDASGAGSDGSWE